MSTGQPSRDDAEREAAVEAGAKSDSEQPLDFLDVYSSEIYVDDFDTSNTDGEGYARPEPPPLPLVAPATVLGALAIAVGVGLLFYPAVLTSFLGVSTTFALLLAGLLFAVGAVTLIGRLRNPDPEEPEDPDLGAQV